MMWLNIIPFGQLFVVLLLLQYMVMPSSAANNLAQLKNKQQQTLGQASTSMQQQPQQQHQQQHVHSQTQQQSVVIPAKAVAHPSNSGIHGSNGGHHNTASQNLLPPSSSLSSSSASSSSSSVTQLPPAQFVNDKEANMQDVYKHFNTDDDLNDPYLILNDLKRDVHTGNMNHPGPGSASSISSASNYPWNLYDRPYATSAINNIPPPTMAGLFSHLFNPFESFSTPFQITPRFMPIMSYPQPVYVPYPLYMSPEMFFPRFSPITSTVNDYEDSMSRGAGSSRRPPSGNQHTPTSYTRNSPIYYVRLPPTPYMFLPSLGLANPASAMSGYPAMLPYQSMPSYSAFSSVFNVPLNFLANGKPNNIYQMSGPPNDIQQSPLQFANIPSSFNTRPPPPPPPNSYRPSAASHNYFNSQPPTVSSGYGSYDGSSSASSSASSSSSSIHQDSKLTSLKRPYYFNGRPEDIYILPNNFNSLYSSENTYY